MDEFSWLLLTGFIYFIYRSALQVKFDCTIFSIVCPKDGSNRCRIHTQLNYAVWYMYMLLPFRIPSWNKGGGCSKGNLYGCYIARTTQQLLAMAYGRQCLTNWSSFSCLPHWLYVSRNFNLKKARKEEVSIGNNIHISEIRKLL